MVISWDWLVSNSMNICVSLVSCVCTELLEYLCVAILRLGTWGDSEALLQAVRYSVAPQ